LVVAAANVEYSAFIRQNIFMKSLTIRSKILLAFSIVSLASTVAFTIYAYFLQRNTILSGIDQKLSIAAMSVATILPDGFHDRIEGSNSISSADHLENMRILTDFAKKADISFIYSFVKVNSNVYFTSTSGTEEQFKTGNTVPFFEHYKDVTPDVLRMFETGETITEAAQDEYGAFRSVLFPLKNSNNQNYVVGADIYTDRVNQQLKQTLLLCISIGLASFLAVFLVSIQLSNRVTDPIIQLARQTNQLGDNNFIADEKNIEALLRIAEKRHDEVGHLAGSFSQMLRQLQRYIEDLKITTAAKERIESELKIAHDIQMSFLTKIFPKKQEFELYATLEPAKEVGGDLYDFFRLDDEHLFFYVGDVSDKGVPAALFMAVTMSLMKRTAQQIGIAPNGILSRVNMDLASENDNLLFVTLFCAILNIRTGELVYSNAGHNPPLIIRADGSADWLTIPKGMVLGVMAETKYENNIMKLNHGDSILLYTDGVTEAMNPARQLYSENKLLELARTMSGMNPEKVVTAVVKSVKEHAATAPQSDDITVLHLSLT